jgi:hypothetical protein
VQVRDVVATAKGAPEKLGHLDPRAAEAFIDRLTAITFIDVGGKGFMGRLRARRYLELRKRLKKELCNGQQKVTYAEAITRIEQIAREETTLIEWLEALAAPLDKSAAHTGELMHERPSGLGTYEPAARAALTPCPAWGISDTYIRIVKQYRPQICMPYADYLMFATPTDGVERTGEAVRINPVFIKAMALAALGVFTLTQENEVQAHEIVEVVFVDANFRLPRTLHTTTRDIPMFAPIVAELNRLLSNGEDPTASVNKGDITLVYPPRGQERDPRDPVPTYGRRRIYIQLNRLNLDREEGRL